MTLRSDRSTIEAHYRDLHTAWAVAKESWLDEGARAFDQRVWRDVESNMARLSERLDAFIDVVERAQRELAG